MKKNEFIEDVTSWENHGDLLKKGQSVRVKKDSLSNRELKRLLGSKYADYIVAHDYSDYSYLIITREV